MKKIAANQKPQTQTLTKTAKDLFGLSLDEMKIVVGGGGIVLNTPQK